VAEEQTVDSEPDVFRRAIRARDHSAWTSLASQCYPLLLRHAVRHLPAGADPESVVQESIYKAFKKASHYDPRRSPFPWIAGFCVNECLRQRRALRRILKGDWNFVHPGGHGAVYQGEARTSVGAALEDLPDREYEVINLRFGFRLSTQEIAEVLGIKPQAAKMALTRALLHLRTSARSEDLREWLTCLEEGRVAK
jgi:RNA polymerase sigma factor (sigma-70 family)